MQFRAISALALARAGERAPTIIPTSSAGALQNITVRNLLILPCRKSAF